MVVTEIITIGSREFQKTYSDMDYKIKQIETGILYDEAIDVIPCAYTYEETDIPLGEIEDNIVGDNTQGIDDTIVSWFNMN